jgi:cytochrome P450
MRITTPPADARIELAQVNLADPGLYTDGDAHLVWLTLRTERPVFWQAQPDGPGFWALTRRADVRRVLADHETFTSEAGTAIAMLDSADRAAGLMMQATDPPRHRQFRRQIGTPYATHAFAAYEEPIRSFVRMAIRPGLDGEIWDAAKSLVRLPMSVSAMMMGLPQADVGRLTELAYASLAPLDPRYRDRAGADAAIFAHFEIIGYFKQQIKERRQCPSSDVISHLLTVRIEGRLLTDEELLLNCLSLLLGAVVTTSHAINATLIAMAEQNGGEGRWAATTPVSSTAEEALRWSSPATHFMRRARRDIEMRGVRISAGDAVTAWIASANRDETVFTLPYKLDLQRFPNPHVTFGYGPHHCLGSHLARFILRISFAELIAGIESFELTGSPTHLVSNQFAGILSLPMRIKSREPGLGAA